MSSGGMNRSHDTWIDNLRKVASNINSQKISVTSKALLALLDSVPAAIGIVRDGTLAWVNSRMEAITGYPLEELLDKRFSDLYLNEEESEHVFSDRVTRIARTGEGETDTLWKKWDGTIVNVHLSWSALDPETPERGFVFTALETTSRTGGDIDKEFMYRAIETSMHAVVFCDLDLNIEWVNGEFLRKFDLEDIGAAKGKSVSSMLDNPESIVDPMLELLETGRWQGELRFQLSDGSTIDTLVSAAILPYASGASRKIIASGMDITKKKLAEKVLRESEERYRVLFKTAKDSIFIKDRSLRYTQVNPAMEKLFELPTSELIGMTDEDLFGPEPASHIREDDFRVLGGETIEEEHTKPVKGIERIFHVIKVPMYDASGGITGICGIARDITERKRLEDQLRHAQKMEAIGQLAGGVAHDFNNLLQVINGYAEMTLEDLDPSHPAHVSIEEIARAGNRAGTLVRQLLSFSRRQIINPAALDLNEAIDKLMKMIRRVIGEYIELEFIPGQELGTIHADRGQMEQLLMNLCVNSRDAMPNGGTITIKTGNVLFNSEQIKTHPWAKPGRYVLLSVSDTGCGMDEETLSSVFDPFFTTKEVGKGTGLGLSTIYGIVKQHGGQIQVYSEVGKGTMFSIYLPAVEHRAVEVSSSVDSPIPGGTETILVAEDDDMVRKLTVQTLERAGYTVLDARNGKEAVRLFEAHADEIALAVLDVVMPELSGRQAHDRMKEIRPDVRVLFSSGYSHSDIHTRFVLDEGLQLIQKPYSPDDLIRRAREVLDT